MRIIYRTPRLTNAEQIAALLEERGIETRVLHGPKHRRATWRGVNYNDPGDNQRKWPAVMVVSNGDLPEARAILRESGLMEPAATLDVAGHTVAKTDVWGQGPALLQVLGMVDEVSGGLPDHPASAVSGRGVPAPADPSTVEGVHTLVEAWKLAMADREAWLGDSLEDPVDVAALTDRDYLRQRAGLIGEHASRELRPGSPGGCGRRPSCPCACSSATWWPCDRHPACRTCHPSA